MTPRLLRRGAPAIALLAVLLATTGCAITASAAAPLADGVGATADPTAGTEENPLAAGTPVVSGRWEIRTGVIAWDQSAAVAEATFSPATFPDTFDWATLPISVTNRGAEAATPSRVTITLNAGVMSLPHTEMHRHYPKQTLPSEFVAREIGPGEEQRGNVGWLWRNTEHADCLLRVDVLTATHDLEQTWVRCGPSE